MLTLACPNAVGFQHAWKCDLTWRAAFVITLTRTLLFITTDCFPSRQSNASLLYKCHDMTSNVQCISQFTTYTSEMKTLALLHSCLAGLPDNRPRRTFVTARYISFSARDGEKHTTSPMCCQLLSFLLAAYEISFSTFFLNYFIFCLYIDIGIDIFLHTSSQRRPVPPGHCVQFSQSKKKDRLN